MSLSKPVSWRTEASRVLLILKSWSPGRTSKPRTLWSYRTAFALCIGWAQFCPLNRKILFDYWTQSSALVTCTRFLPWLLVLLYVKSATCPI
jgi:hypothetical protein